MISPDRERCIGGDIVTECVAHTPAPRPPRRVAHANDQVGGQLTSATSVMIPCRYRSWKGLLRTRNSAATSGARLLEPGNAASARLTASSGLTSGAKFSTHAEKRPIQSEVGRISGNFWATNGASC
jgi:hypothetical protein